MIIRSKAPLRIGLAGGGTDVSPYCDTYGGIVLNAAIDMFAYCTIEPTSDNTIIFKALDRGESFFSEGHSKLEIDDVLIIHKGVYNRIVEKYNNGNPLSLRMTTYSDAPAGSGLGSSSTMIVAIIKSYMEWLNLPLGEYDIAELAYEIERKDLGMSGGKQDQFSATFGGFNFMEFFADDKVVVNPLRLKRWIRNEIESSLILYYTGTSRESAKIIDEQIKNVENRSQKNLNAMHDLKAITIEMKNAILRGDFVKFASCLKAGWEAKKKMATSISNDVINTTYEFIMANGGKAAKISGAGGGGFMMILCDPEERYNLVKKLKNLNGHVMLVHFSEEGAQAWTLRD
jgi:D-glycero-alpha-D-manno-heptose-7-phosphate kinase